VYDAAPRVLSLDVTDSGDNVKAIISDDGMYALLDVDQSRDRDRDGIKRISRKGERNLQEKKYKEK
jgi:hypothetical protein